MDESERDKPENDIEAEERAEFLEAMQQDIDVAHAGSGEIVTGTIVSVGSEFAFVDLGSKSEGVISVEEIRKEDGVLPSVGDEVEACVISSGSDGLILSKRLAKGIRDREFLKEAARNRIPVEGRVVGTNKGGFEVEVAVIRAFCPVGQIELRFCEDPEVHVGKKYAFLVTKYDDSGRRPDMVVSRKELLQAEAEKQADSAR